jgi:hypothetical protein
LATPVEAHGEEITVLRLRRPNAADLAECGMPFKMGQDGVIDLNPRAMMQLAARLASVPPSTVGSMDISDFIALQGVLANFFAPRETTTEAAESSTPPVGLPPPSTSRGSGPSTPQASFDSHGPNLEFTPNKRRVS